MISTDRSFFVGKKIAKKNVKKKINVKKHARIKMIVTLSQNCSVF